MKHTTTGQRIKNQLKDNYGALADLGFAVQNPDYFEAYMFRGFVKMDNHDDYSATLDYTKAIKLSSRNPEAYFQRAKAYRNMDNFKEAEHDLSTAIKINPNYTEAYFIRALVNFQIWDFKQTVKDCEMAIKLGLGKQRKTFRAY